MFPISKIKTWMTLCSVEFKLRKGMHELGNGFLTQSYRALCQFQDDLGI